MKKVFTALSLFIFTLFIGCDKGATLPLELDGKWEGRFLKGDPDNDIYRFSGNTFQRTINMKPAGSGTFEVTRIDERDKSNGVVYPYKITFIIDGSRLGTYLRQEDNTIVISSGRADSDETHFTYDKVK